MAKEMILAFVLRGLRVVKCCRFDDLVDFGRADC